MNWHPFELGAVLRGRYKLTESNDRRMVWTRIDSGKTENVSKHLLDRVRGIVLYGGSMARRANGPDGISYTVLVETVVVAALGLKLNQEGRWSK